MTNKKQITIEITSIVSIIITFLSLVNAGIFAGIEYVKIWSYTIPQLIFFLLAFFGTGIVVGDLVFYGKSRKDAAKNIKELFGQTLGMSDKELERLKDDVSVHYKRKILPESEKLVNATSINFTESGFTYPTPGEIKELVMDHLASILPASSITLAMPSEYVHPAGMVSIMPVQPASIEHLTTSDTHMRKKIIITAIFALAAAVIYLITTFGGK